MSNLPHEIDWNYIRTFLTVVDVGNLSRAAKVLGQTQPTIGRQISALEMQLALPLFDRVHNQLRLTEKGAELAEKYRPMQDAIYQAAIAAQSFHDLQEEDITITATDIVSRFVMPSALKAIHKQAPHINITLLSTDQFQDINKREADIAVRNLRPSDPELIAQKVGTSSAYFYGATTYLDRVGRPKNIFDLENHQIIAYDDPKAMISELGNRDIKLTTQNFRFASNDSNALWQMVCDGMGLGIMVDYVGDKQVGVEKLNFAHEPIVFDTWITTHAQLRKNPNIRLVYDYVLDALMAFVD